jgi:hypothetical protein|nr:MAG TPA: hypothetical protein [Caudoviricetes sp.]
MSSYAKMTLNELHNELNRLKNITICLVYPHHRPEYRACMKRYNDLREFINAKAIA